MRAILTAILLCLPLLSLLGQRIENVKANYQNDTLAIFFDVSGKAKLDSIEVIISSTGNNKGYDFIFLGDINKEIEPGTKKKIWAYIHRDSFPKDGDALRIRLKGYTKSNTKSKKGNWKRGRRTRFFFDIPQNPRFSIVPSVGIISRSSEFSKIGKKASGVFYYHPSDWFQVGMGGSYYDFSDSIKNFSTAYGMISTKFTFQYLQIPKYFLMDFGYCYFNEGPVISAGIGYTDVIVGPVNIDINAQINKFFGYYSFYTFSLNAGISLNFSSRKRYTREKIYKFKDIMIYAEIGTNYLTKLSPTFSFDVAYKIAPNYTQGVGLSFESIKYQLNTEYKTYYYSEYYKKNIEYIAGIVDYELKVIIIPIYLNGRLYLSAGKFRPYLLWKYGFTLYSHVDRGQLENGFVGDLGFGFQYPIDKKKALTFSLGTKFFDNKYKFNEIENNTFGTLFIKTGIVF